MKLDKVLLAFLLLSGCSSASGVKVSEDDLSRLKSNKATIQTVTARYGQPDSTQLMPNGERSLTYTYSTVSRDPKSYIPIVGPFVGGGSGFSIASATLTFSADGVLQTYQTNNSRFGSGANDPAVP